MTVVGVWTRAFVLGGLFVVLSCEGPEDAIRPDAGSSEQETSGDAGEHGGDAGVEGQETGVDAGENGADAGECEPGCNESACQQCQGGECVSFCQGGEVCDGAGSCDLADRCDGVPSLQEASGGQILRTDDVILPRFPGEEPRNGFEFQGVFERSFPGRQVQQRFKLNEGTYASMRFTTPADLEVGHQGSFTSEVLLGAGGGLRVISFSRCEGDFDASRLDSRCIRQIDGASGISWSVDPDDPVRCPLEPDTEYFLNIVYSTEPLSTSPDERTWDCPGILFERCGKLLSPGHNYRTPECGPHAMEFGAGVTGWPELEPGEVGFCDGGPQPDPLPEFPDSGGSVTWQCELPAGVQLGTPPTCSATRG